MSDFAILVIGGGTGNNVVAAAAEAGLETALYEKGPLGGTYLNRGCDPSKILIQRANDANEIRTANRFGIEASIESIDYAGILAERHDVFTGYRPAAVTVAGKGVSVDAESEAGDAITELSDYGLVALSRRGNSGILNLEATGVDTDDRGFIRMNEFRETVADREWAHGDITGNFLFKHTGDYVTRVTVADVVGGGRKRVDYTATPQVIFTEPQIAGVGATEDDLDSDGREYVAGTAQFAENPMGRSKRLDRWFVMMLAVPDGTLLGCHIVGESASRVIHEAVVSMRTRTVHVDDIAEKIHAHSTLSKVVEAAARDVPS